MGQRVAVRARILAGTAASHCRRARRRPDCPHIRHQTSLRSGLVHNLSLHEPRKCRSAARESDRSQNVARLGSPSTDQPFGCGADRQPPTQRSVRNESEAPRRVRRPPETPGRFSAATSSARVVSLIRLPYQVRIPASISRLRRRATSFSDVGDTCFHRQRLGDAIAGEEKARSDHCGDEGAAPPDGVR
jgi:hypothetical protein